MYKCYLSLFFLFSTISLTIAQTKLIEKVGKKGDEIVIPYEKYQLNNGLTIIIHEDHSDPIVHVDVTYHVGSAREELGKSGFAHFFEHMMFQGSENVADEEHFKIISEAGGVLNGTTNSDRTNYFETVPSNQLEKILWLEADRMGFLLNAVTQQKFEIQRATVKNERAQRYDNVPYGRVGEKIIEALYPTGHPYSWPTIGWLEDLDRANVNDLKNFFLRWYGPNNATLTVAGDVNPKELIPLCEKYFGSISEGPKVEMQKKETITLDKDRYISYEDNIRFPQISMVFPTVPSWHPDEAALDIFADILGGSKNSIFYKNFIKAQKAMQAFAQNPTQELGGQLILMVRTFPEKSLKDMEELMRESFLEFEKRGVTDDDLIRFKSKYEANMLSSLTSVSGKASQLANYQTFTGNANYIKEDIERYMRVTKEDVIRVYNQYLKGKSAVILSVYPKGKPELAAKPDNFTVIKNNYKVDSEPRNLVYKRPVDSFDRSKKPPLGPDPLVKVPEYWQEIFANKLKVIGASNNEVPFISLTLSIEAGHKMETYDKSKAGLAYLVAGMLNESTENYTGEEISDKLEKLGSSINVTADNHFITFSVNSLQKNLDATLSLLEEKLLHPGFEEAVFNRLKEQLLENIANQATQPKTIADKIYARLLYGDKNIMGIPIVGSTESVNNISLQDVKTYYQNFLSPSVSSLVIVGDIGKNTILPMLGFLKNWKAKEIKIPVQEQSPEIEKTKIYLVNKENAAQSEIRTGYLALPYDAMGEYYKASLMNFALGGTFNSRINLNLREARGYTYNAYSRFHGDKWRGPFTVSTGVKTVSTDSSIIEIMREIKTYSEQGIKDDEILFTKNSIRQREALNYETPVQKAMLLKKIIDYDLDRTFIDKQNTILKNITREELNQLAQKYLPFDKMLIVVVGDKKIIEPNLLKLGYEVVELNTEGERLP